VRFMRRKDEELVLHNIYLGCVGFFLRNAGTEMLEEVPTTCLS
jgi:hypothetical protein